MNAKSVFLAVLLFAFGTTACQASDVNLGVWKLNEAKSSLGPGAPKNHTVTYTMVGDQMKCSVDGTDSAGTPTHNEWTGRFDGKDYPVSGDPTSDTRSYTRIDAHTLALVGKKDGKETLSGRITVSADGKSRTVTLSAKDDTGKPFQSTAVYDKQ